MALRRRGARVRERLRARVVGRRPRLSVVVPVYNVEDYLEECLQSLLDQTYRDFEIVIIDDGSTDGSAAIAQRYAHRFRHVRLICTENHGLGAARNTGVHHVRGELIAFADSDDIVPADAYDAMVGVLDESGSDFVVGAVQRWSPRGTSMTPRQRRLHRERRLAITADDYPEILADVFAWNKIYRRDFWERAGLSFPEGIRYEDQVALTQAYLTARCFDVIKRPVYRWRRRDDRSSITQRRQDIADLRDRFQTKRDSLDIVRRLGSDPVLESFFLVALAMDLPNYFQHIPTCSDEYWQLLHTELRDLWTGGPSFAGADIPVAQRLTAWLVTENRRSDAEAVLAFAERHRPKLPVDEQDGLLVAQLPFRDDPSSGIPAELYHLQDRERAGH